MPEPVELLVDEDVVSRQVNSPGQYDPLTQALIADTFFTWSSGYGQSVVWRKYAVTDADMHSYGCVRQAHQRQKNSEWTYEGAMTTGVAAVRALRSAAGHGFDVVHAPEEGIHHAEINFLAAPGKQIEKRERTDLRLVLRNFFLGLQMQPHICGAEPQPVQP